MPPGAIPIRPPMRLGASGGYGLSASPVARGTRLWTWSKGNRASLSASNQGPSVSNTCA